jgi:hypothetical protein
MVDTSYIANHCSQLLDSNAMKKSVSCDKINSNNDDSLELFKVR